MDALSGIPGLFMTTVALRIKSSVCPSSSHSIIVYKVFLVFIFNFSKIRHKTAYPLLTQNGSAYATSPPPKTTSLILS
jgi:hypothetical protein